MNYTAMEQYWIWLASIEGIGPKRRKALLEAFGSVDEIRKIAAGEDPVDNLMRAEGVDRRSAENVAKFFHKT